MGKSNPLYQGAKSGTSPTLSQGDHVRMLVEMLQPLGPELVRRWVAALMMVDRDDREAMVAAIERKVVENYGPGTRASPELVVVHAPTRKNGNVERLEAEYSAEPSPARSRPSVESIAKPRRARA